MPLATGRLLVLHAYGPWPLFSRRPQFSISALNDLRACPNLALLLTPTVVSYVKRWPRCFAVGRRAISSSTPVCSRWFTMTTSWRLCSLTRWRTRCSHTRCVLHRLALVFFSWTATPSPNYVGNPGWHRTRKRMAYRVSCYTHRL